MDFENTNKEYLESEKIYDFLKDLGFEENEEMKGLAMQISEKMKFGDDFINDYINYQNLAQRIVDAGENQAKGQLALIVRNAIIYRDGRELKAYSEALQEAKVYARNLGLDAFADMIKILE